VPLGYDVIVAADDAPASGRDPLATISMRIRDPSIA
jgi:hypothetical protein